MAILNSDTSLARRRPASRARAALLLIPLGMTLLLPLAAARLPYRLPTVQALGFMFQDDTSGEAPVIVNGTPLVARQGLNRWRFARGGLWVLRLGNRQYVLHRLF